MQRVLKYLVFVLLVLAFSTKAAVQYQVDIIEPDHHLAEITIVLPKGSEQMDLMLPAWRTGKYKILNFASGVRNFSAQDKQNNTLKWQRIDKSHWRVLNPNQSEVKVKYLVYANELESRTRHIDESHAFLDATSVLMYESSQMNDIHRVKLIVPSYWKSYSGMTQTAEHEFIAQSYHQLASSPIETGMSQLQEFSVGQQDYQLVVWGEGNYSLDKMVKDLKRLVAQSQTIWQGYPFKKYLFIVHATSGATGATEHINSTIIQRPRFSFAPDKEYLKFLRTASHEFVHTWNVKAYRPKALVPYDYQQENYTDLLWLAEGSTSYFQERLLLTAELQSLKEFLKQLSDRIYKFQHRPGHKLQSVAESSKEAWIAQSGDFSNNHSVNIYSAGYIASWLFDYQMLIKSDLKVGYKNLHSKLYSKTNQNDEDFKRLFARGFDSAEVIAIASELTGENFEQWWQESIVSPLNVNFDDLLNHAGLKFVPLDDQHYVAWIGVDTSEEKGALILNGVEKGGPAWKAGLTTDDELVAIDGFKVNHSTFKAQIAKYKPGTKIELAIFRNDKLQKRVVTLGKITKKTRKIELVESPSQAQKSYFKAWLGIDFPLKESE
ncbi:M61 family metallopeptidase [Aliikangiella sp. IMCC44359]|uniref:M61 family metallopeptidase n=1 Tax=Aliikangiella sp. IMCC44359 TaxID=3459125 RepID=UPI00403A8C1B